MKSKTKSKNKEGDILAIKARDQYRTVDELVKKSQPNSVYYTLLVVSSLIIAFGLLLENSSVVIGGMLVTPVLTPVLYIALGVATGEVNLIRQVSLLLFKSFAIVFASGFIAASLFEAPENLTFFNNDITVPALYFGVALLSGVAATFAWSRKDVIDILPGVAIAVALVPPLSLSGIGLSLLNPAFIRLNFLIFLFNLFGVVMGSLVVFSLLGFYKTKSKVHMEAQKVDKDNKKA